jgi:hypothetical protein
MFFLVSIHYRDLFRDYRVRKLHTGQAIFLFLEAALQSRMSLSNISAHLKAKKWLQDWLEIDCLHGSSLHRKLEDLPLDLLQEMFSSIVRAVAGHYAGKEGIGKLGKFRIIDSTEICLPPVYGTWAYVSKSKNAVKMHTALLVGDQQSVCPERIILSTADVSDQDTEIVCELVTESTNTQVFDRGYINYSHYFKWWNKDIRFVARVKSNSRFRLIREREPSANSHVLRDADVELTDPESGSTFQLRLVEYTYVDAQNKTHKIRVVTNRWDLTAEEITDIYRYRWKIELFFKSLKQHVNLKKLYNHKEKAVWNQLYISLIAYALCELIRLTVKPEKSCWEIQQFLNLYADQTAEELLAALNDRPLRTSKGRRKKAKIGRPRKHPKVHKPAHKIVK